MVLGISAIFTTAFLVALYNLSLTRPVLTATYRIHVLVFFAIWSATLWLRSYEPSTWLMVTCAVLAAIVPGLAFVPRRAPKNRKQTKALLEQLHSERQLHSVFGTKIGMFFWPVLWGLIWSIFYRLALIYSLGVV
jgi:hypothetical protein